MDRKVLKTSNLVNEMLLLKGRTSHKKIWLSVFLLAVLDLQRNGDKMYSRYFFP